MSLSLLFLPAKRKHSSFALGFGGPNFPKASKQIFAGGYSLKGFSFCFSAPPVPQTPHSWGVCGFNLYHFLFFIRKVFIGKRQVSPMA